MVSKPQISLSESTVRSQVGRVSGAEEARDPEVSWCEMPGAVNCAGGSDEFAGESNSNS